MTRPNRSIDKLALNLIRTRHEKKELQKALIRENQLKTGAMDYASHKVREAKEYGIQVKELQAEIARIKGN